MNLGAVMETTEWLKQIYIDTAHEAGYKPGPEHFGYLLKVFCADTDEKAIELGRNFVWTEAHRQRGPREHVDPPGYQSREALNIKRSRPTGAFAGYVGDAWTYDRQREAKVIIAGNPDTVLEGLTWVIEHLHPGYLHIYGNEGPMPHKDTMRSIELLGKEVIPALHEIKLQPYE
jgi:alkanesulfonate monooxygenase SsuD/methylene tetrahydromethanopterin reductase-like flavin-dependent oxidoreductase (luciferase family)